MCITRTSIWVFDNTTVSAVDKAVNGLMDALRYNELSVRAWVFIVMGDGEFYISHVVIIAQSKITPT